MKTENAPQKIEKSALIILNGTSPSISLLNRLWEKADFRICADGAAEALCLKKKRPDLIIGDFDSITASTRSYFQSVEQLHLPDQYTTDGEKALEQCLERNLSKVEILGLLGDRLDHTLYNLELVKKYTGRGLEITAYTESEKIFILDRSTEIYAEPGTRISISPILGNVEGVTIEGLEYDVQNTCFEFGSFSSISNTFKQSSASISFSSGRLLVALQHS